MMFRIVKRLGLLKITRLDNPNQKLSPCFHYFKSNRDKPFFHNVLDLNWSIISAKTYFCQVSSTFYIILYTTGLGCEPKGLSHKYIKSSLDQSWTIISTAVENQYFPVDSSEQWEIPCTCKMEQGRKSEFKSLMQTTAFPVWVSKKHFKIPLPEQVFFSKSIWSGLGNFWWSDIKAFCTL